MADWVTAVIMVGGIALEGLILGFATEFLIKLFHPHDGPGDMSE